MSPLVFFLLAVPLVAFSLGVVLARSPVRSALSLVVALFFLAAFFFLLDARMIAALQVIVYAGAIMVLFLFVIMLLNLQHEPIEQARPGQKTIAAVFSTVFVLLMGAVALRGLPAMPGPGVERAVAVSFGSVEAVAERLFTRHALAFEVTSVLLLVAVMGAVVLARKIQR
ncbi:MAG: NADH-quinone oxidoreductase subunit J [Candidatus Binatia bacterium]|nr:NADH-quinone oxidoreductase subunit J [Candidatus Binatia bacterium]